MFQKKFSIYPHFKQEHKAIYPIWRLDCVNQDGEEIKIKSKDFESKMPAYFAGVYYTLFGN